jgi:glycine betaine/choline ABC-type transport system substrate-binding protein
VRTHLIKLATVAAGAALLAAACGSSKSSSSGATTSAGATTTAASSTSSGSETTTGASTTASGGSTSVAPAGIKIDFKPLDTGGPLTIAALANGDIQMGLLFSSDGTIAQKGWVALQDDKQLQPSDNLVVVGSKDKLTDAYAGVLNNMMSMLTTEDLQALNVKMNVDKEEPAAVAKEWLQSKGLLTTTPTLTGKLTVGSANFNEQELVAEMVSQVLAAKGVDITKKFKLGAREVVAPALEKGEIDAYVEYIGSYLTFLGGTPSGDPATTLAALQAKLAPKNLVALQPSPAQDENAFVVTQETATKDNLKTISDLRNLTGKFTFGGPPECPTRPLCIQGLEQTYGLQFNT